MSSPFAHDRYSTVNRISDNIVWDFFSNKNDISFYIDGDVLKGIHEKNNGKLKYLWTLESPKFNNGVFDFILNNLEEVLSTYEMIFTYNEHLLSINEKFKWVPAMGTWIKEPKIYEKSKLISMITSNKMFTPQQSFRVNFANENKNKIDVFGRGFKEIQNKEEGLIDYMFSVCVENDTFDTYFTEKILDCFATGTIPIYKGSKNIINYFNPNGIIFLDDLDLNTINENLYFSKLDYVKENFERSLEFMLPEDYFFKKYFK
jgi:hypothetical protein